MNGHETFSEDLTRYLLDELSPGERSELEHHLGSCGECRAELDKLRAAEALLTLTSAETAPPPRARARLMAAIEHEPRMAVVTGSAHRRAWWIWIPTAATLALAIAVGLLWQENSDLREKADKLAALEAQEQLDTQKSKEMVVDLTAKGALHMNLSETGMPPQPHGKATYNPKDGGIVFVGSNLVQLPEGSTYQLWIVPVNGGTPIPAGTFKPGPQGTAVVMKHDVPKVRPKMFAVSVEPEKPGRREPTSPMVLSSSGE